MARSRPLILAAVLALSTTGVFFVDVCALVYDCGCLSLWEGASAACNIHEASGPHCPWCEHPLAGGAIALLGTMAVQLGVLLSPGSATIAVRFVLSLLAFPIASGTIGWVQGLLFNYWGYWSSGP